MIVPRLLGIGEPHTDCVAAINQLRACRCLPPLERYIGAEVCADSQATYDSTRSAHQGFADRICQPAGSAQNECPNWPSTTAANSTGLQMMFELGPSITGVPNQYDNMLSTTHTRVACGFSSDGTSVWSVQNYF